MCVYHNHSHDIQNNNNNVNKNNICSEMSICSMNWHWVQFAMRVWNVFSLQMHTTNLYLYKLVS